MLHTRFLNCMMFILVVGSVTNMVWVAKELWINVFLSGISFMSFTLLMTLVDFGNTNM